MSERVMALYDASLAEEAIEFENRVRLMGAFIGGFEYPDERTGNARDPEPVLETFDDCLEYTQLWLVGKQPALSFFRNAIVGRADKSGLAARSVPFDISDKELEMKLNRRINV